LRILHAAAELFPYVKVGGLGDVMAALPGALRAAGADVRLLLPGHPPLLQALAPFLATQEVPDLLGAGPARLHTGRTPEGVPVYLLDHPFFDRPGGPYEERGDSALRFGAFSWMAARLARQGDAAGWVPEVLHLHDWQTALAPVYLGLEGPGGPRTVLTVHNLAYQGLYPPGLLPALRLPAHLFHLHGVEFFGQLGFLKAGLQAADRLTTVSPTYAREIQTPAFGEGLEGLLAHRRQDLVGILNGVDYRVWHPARSPHLPARFDLGHPAGKEACRAALRAEMGLGAGPEPLFGVVSRLTGQKGLDLLLAAVDSLGTAQLAILGTGDPLLEKGFRAAARRHAGRVAFHAGYDEPLSHRLIAGADALVVPSRFEPCGLTQLYAMAHGTLPVASRTGGLADTIIDGETGFLFEGPTAPNLIAALQRARDLFSQEPRTWTHMRRQAMAQDFGWDRSAREYLALYRGLLGG
jgi:starch synthase